VITLSAEVREKLAKQAASLTAEHRVVVRSRVILLAADGASNEEIAHCTGTTPRTVGKWRRRFFEKPTLEALNDASRSGRPPRVALADRLEVIKLACNRPDKDKTPYREVWTQQALADALFAETGIRLSRSEVCRILNAEGLRPHLVRPWLHSPDPEFRPKVERICDLYLTPPPDAVVVCVDEKPMQVLSRKHPTRVKRRAVVGVEYEYKRHGTQSLLGAFDTKTGQVFGRVVPKRSGEALVAFMNDLAARYPGREVYVVWDNLNIHYNGKVERWTEFNRMHGGRFHFVYTPLHASWVNQVEVWFSILERRVLRHGSFKSKAEQAQAVHGFIDHWNQHEVRPFRWTFRGRFEQSRAV
jgi:transposase